MRGKVGDRLVGFCSGPLQVTLIVVATLGVVAWADFATGTEIRLYPLYLVPLGLAALRMSITGSVLCALSATAIWASANRMAGLTYGQPSTWLINVGSQMVAFLSFVVLVQSLKRSRDAEHRLARTDPLTNLSNARAFYEASARELSRQRRYGHPVSLLYLDLDNFKRINDKLGHVRADELLVEVAKALRAAVRATDVVARLGGDEFAVLYPQTNERELSVAAARLQRAVLERVTSPESRVTCSIGGVTFESAPESVEAMVATADAVMYEVKGAGKNSVRTRVCDPTPSDATSSAAPAPQRGAGAHVVPSSK